MSETHTPGPWEACEPGAYSDFDGESRVVCGDDMRIAVVHWHPRLGTEMSDANARLIAAAPDMLAVLNEISYHADNQDMSHLDFRVLMAEAARDVIAKAVQS